MGILIVVGSELLMPNYKYQIGDKVGVNKDITLLERLYPTHDRKGYICKFLCPYCGKEFVGELYSVNSVNFSCGCYRAKNTQFQPEDLTGKKFGYLEAIKDTGKRVTTKQGEKVNAIWLCKCTYQDCGNLIEVSTAHLKDGHTLSCGRHNISKGEAVIESVLRKLKLDFVPEKTFSDCRNPSSGCLLRYDFYLPKLNCCIEYNGEQHYHIPWNKKSTFFSTEQINQIQQRDKIKESYCSSKGIYLIVIPYTDLSKISPDYLKTKIKNVVREEVFG